MKNLKLLIIILTILAIGITGLILILGVRNNQNNNNNVIQNDTDYNTNIPENNILEEESIKGDLDDEQQTTQKTEMEQAQEDVATMEEYMKDYSFHIFNNIEKAYNLLEQEYRQKRFPTIDIFSKYITEKQHQLRNIQIRQYRKDKYENYVIYKGTDENGNYYEIKVTASDEYTIILDSYTLQEDYSNKTTEEKIKKSVEKFILMLNSADYANAYNLLDKTFRITNFPTEQDFINYIKNNWFERNIIASRDVLEDGTCVVTMQETIATTSKKLKKQFSVALGENMTFTIKFNI